jgi:hypothetical protein
MWRSAFRPPRLKSRTRARSAGNSRRPGTPEQSTRGVHNERLAFHKRTRLDAGVTRVGGAYWKGEQRDQSAEERRSRVIQRGVEWFLGLFRWLAWPFLVLTMLEQPPVLFKLI